MTCIINFCYEKLYLYLWSNFWNTKLCLLLYLGCVLQKFPINSLYTDTIFHNNMPVMLFSVIPRYPTVSLSRRYSRSILAQLCERKSGQDLNYIYCLNLPMLSQLGWTNLEDLIHPAILIDHSIWPDIRIISTN